AAANSVIARRCRLRSRSRAARRSRTPDPREAPLERPPMTFLLHGATLTLACFLIVNLAASIAVAGIATRPPRIASPVFWFAPRLLPAAVATSFAVIVFVPSYWRYQPRESVEGFAVTLTA